MKCNFCNKRVWFWQASYRGIFHIACWLKDVNIKHYEYAIKRYKDMDDEQFVGMYKKLLQQSKET